MKGKRIILSLALLFTFLFSIKANASTSSISAGKVVTNGSNLNIREKPSTSSTILSKAKNGSFVTVLRNDGNWYYVEYKENSYGYVHKSYINIVSKTVKRANTGGGNLNARTGPSMNYSIFDKIANKDYMVELESYNYWLKVLFEGNKVGYVYKSLTSSVDTFQQSSVKLPSYKQYDSRWASTYIPNTAKTIKQIGCLVTSMSMSESYRTGQAITPLDMIKRTKFTANGDMYWPSNYSFITSSSNYLSKIYNLLKEGKPVLIGAKNLSGGQHWVIIYGYNGGSTLTSSNFLINDPGSSTRVNLAQFFSSYPLFYKIAYYK